MGLRASGFRAHEYGKLLNFSILNFILYLTGSGWDHDILTRCVQGVTSVLLSLQKNPFIRYQNNSKMAKRLAETIRVCYKALANFILALIFSYHSLIKIKIAYVIFTSASIIKGIGVV